VALACSQPVADTGPIRLVDRFHDAQLEGSPEAPEAPARTEWVFTEPDAIGGSWSSGQQTDDVELTQEGLSGRASGPRSTIFLERAEPAGTDDRLHEIVVRMRVSAGANMSVLTLGPDGPPSQALAAAPGDLTHSTPLVPGEDFRTYTIQLDRSFGLGPTARSAVTRVVLRPTDEAGADFTVESVRLVFRKERFAAIESGIGWHGLAEVWRDTIISRAPETVTWQIEVPSNAWLDLSLGTVSDGPVGFAVELAGSGGDAETIHEETLTSSERWKLRRIELDEWAGQTVDLTLAASGEEGALAFWGSPVVRTSMRTAEGEQPRARGVIVVLADTLRKHHLTAYGHERDNSPNLSRMVSEGVLFKDALTQGTWTKVSVPSILSSLYPSTHEIVSFNDRLPSAATTLAEALQAEGFATWASSSVPFSGQLTNLHQGVETLYEVGSIEGDEIAQSKTGRFYVDELIPWLEQHHDVPFFAFVHAMDPHSPYRPYAPYDTLWTPEADGKRYESDMEKVREHIEDPALKRFGMPSRKEMEAAGLDIESYLAHERAWYDASILGLDTEVGRLFETLRRLGRDEDTVVAFVSDHGEEFLEHGHHWHGLTVYAEMTEVPLIVRFPAGVPGGKVVESSVQTLDLMPTLLELAGVPIPETAQGRSLVPLWSGSGDGRPLPAFSERKALMGLDDPNSGFARSDSFALVQDGWRLIWNTRQEPGVPEFELYRRETDPLDQNNVAQDHPEVVAELKAVIERWQESAIAARLKQDEGAEGDLSADELERLRALGYI
jgi:arylsulfatase A-like enzyme